MEGNYYHSGPSSRNRYDKLRNLSKAYTNYEINNRYTNDHPDDDLIIEDNTIYEIDRECYERLKRQKKKRS